MQNTEPVRDYILLLIFAFLNLSATKKAKKGSKKSSLDHTSFPCRHLLSRYRAVINGSIDSHTNLIIYSYSVSGAQTAPSTKSNHIMRIPFTSVVTQKLNSFRCCLLLESLHLLLQQAFTHKVYENTSSYTILNEK